MADLIKDGFPFTTAQAPHLGLSAKLLRLHHERGLVRREFRGVYVDARVPDSRSSRLRGIKLATPDNAVVCDETAAWVHKLDVFAPGRRHDFVPSVVMLHGRGRIRRPGSRGRQAIIVADDIDFMDGVHLTTPLRTTSDLLRKMYRPYALAAADAFAHAGLVEVDELVDRVVQLKGYRGIVQARSLALMVEAKTQSPGESWQRLRLLDAGMPPPDPQFEVVDDFGRSFFIDLPYPELLIGTEYDGWEFHTAEDHRDHDHERRDYLTNVYGWRWVIGDRSRIFGTDTSFEHEVGALMGIEPLARWWGSREESGVGRNPRRAASDPSRGDN